MRSSNFINGLVDNEVRRIVAAEIEDGGVLGSAQAVAAIKLAYPNIPLSDRELENSVIAAASYALVPVEVGGATESRLSFSGSAQQEALR